MADFPFAGQGKLEEGRLRREFSTSSTTASEERLHLSAL
jgi:hypothetical protein